MTKQRDYLLTHGTRANPQREQIRADQIPNSEGGFVWAIDKFARLRRFLILGSEGGSFYATERELTFQNVKCVRECIAEDGVRAVREIVEVSASGRAPKNDPALFALACALSLGDRATKSAAAEALPLVARIGTHLYHFVAYMETMRGWGRTARWAVGNWYATKGVERLPYDAIKYRKRDDWSHRDLLRLAHPENPALAGIFDYIVGRGNEMETEPDALFYAFEQAQAASSPAETAALVRKYSLPREALKSEHLNDREVWEAMLEMGMPTTALIRNLANMTRVGVLGGPHLALVTSALTNEEQIRKSRVHPFALLVALRTYASGKGFRSSNTWVPVMAVTDALDEAFYLAFGNVEPTNKRILLGVDVSASMTRPILSGYDKQGRPILLPISAREGAAAMALVTVHAEPNVTVVGFTDRMHTLSYSRRQRLDDVLRATPQTGEGTDCGVPVSFAERTGGAYDAIVLYTDNETWAGNRHVSQAIGSYRDRTGLPTRLVACGMVANEFTVCDPTDPLSLNVVGFDAATPGMISAFANGEI